METKPIEEKVEAMVNGRIACTSQNAETLWREIVKAGGSAVRALEVVNETIAISCMCLHGPEPWATSQRVAVNVIRQRHLKLLQRKIRKTFGSPV